MMSPSRSPIPAPLRRLLRRQRGSMAATALIVATLALALGANTAVFSIADALLLRAVPFPDSSRLVLVTTAFPAIKLTGMNLSGPEALEFQRLTRVFSASGPFQFTGLVVQGAAGAELANAIQVSSGAMAALGARPCAGRPLSEDEFQPGGPAVALLGYGLWTRAFGADPAIVGRVVQLGGVAREVVGIMPEGLTLLNRPIDAWLPLPLTPGTAGSRSDHGYEVVARIASDRTFEVAVADVRRAMKIWRDETGEMHVPTARMHPLDLQPLGRATTGLTREPIGALAAAVAFVLLIACANISNLLVARAERRRADVAIQLALGATRARLLGDSLAEGLALAAAGAAGGVAIAQVMVGLLRAAWPAAANANLSLDYRVLGAAAALAALTGVVIGVAPVARLNVSRASDWLRSGARGGIGGPGRMRAQHGLIALQIALAVLLSACAGLMVRSLLAVTSIESGLRLDGVLRAQVSLPEGAYADDEQVWSFYERVLAGVSQAPGVTHAAVMSGLPPLRRANNTSFLLDGVEIMDHSSFHQVEFVQHISPAYLATVGIPLRLGRALTDADDERGAPVALVNETLARQFWPNDSAIGHRVKPAGNIGTWFTVVGVVADVRQAGLQSPAGSELYVTHRQARRLMSGYMPRTMNVVVRSSRGITAAASALRAAVQQVDPTAALSGIAPMQTILERTIAQPRLLAWMFGAFAVLALVVAGVGVYAVTTYAVGTRTAEFGVRLALGARPVDVLRLVVSGGLATTALGVLAGTLAAAGASRLLRNLLFDIEPLDAASLAGGAVVIAATALVATLLPARRAARVDPLTALRD